MSIKEYNFQEFTNKDMFEMCLAGTIPDFGYIACTKRKPFLDFLIKHGFIKQYPVTTANCNEEITRYDVLMTFRFMGMLDYRPQPIILVEEHGAMVCKSFKIRNLTKVNRP